MAKVTLLTLADPLIGDEQAMVIQGGRAKRSPVSGLALPMLAGLSAQVSTSGPVFWDEDTRVISFNSLSVRLRDSTANTTWTAAGASTWDATFGATGAQLLYLDRSIATASNPLVVAGAATLVPLDSNKIPLAMFWNGGLLPLFQFDLIRNRLPDSRVQHVASNLPIVLVQAGTFGLAARTWMVPITTRYVRGGAAINSIANTASSAVDPTGTYNWSLYAEVACNQTTENSLYLDVSANTVLNAGRTTRMKGTKSGYVELARYHASGDQLSALDAVRVIRAGEDPVTLFGRMGSAEARLDLVEETAAVPAFTSGARLRGLRSKLAAVRAGAAVVLKIVKIGDSWFHRPYLAMEQARRFAADGIAMAASGWIGLGDQPQCNGVTVTWTGSATAPANGAPAGGWTYGDGSYNDANRTDGYAAPDGNTIFTTTDTASVLFAGIKCSTLTFDYEDLTGTLRWRLNGGAWTAVACANTGAVLTVPVAAGLSLSTTHTLEIDTTGNTGKVKLCGVHATAPSGSGVEISNWGNGGSTSINWTNWLASVGRRIALIAPDLVEIHLGVNDQRLSSVGGTTEPADYLAAMQAIIATIEAASPSTRFLLIGPPRNGAGTGAYPMTDYGAKLADIYVSNPKVEIARFDQSWGDYSEEGPGGNNVFQDSFHLKIPTIDPAYVPNAATVRYAGDTYDAFMRRYQ